MPFNKCIHLSILLNKSFPINNNAWVFTFNCSAQVRAREKKKKRNNFDFDWESRRSCEKKTSHACAANFKWLLMFLATRALVIDGDYRRKRRNVGHVFRRFFVLLSPIAEANIDTHCAVSPWRTLLVAWRDCKAMEFELNSLEHFHMCVHTHALRAQQEVVK